MSTPTKTSPAHRHIIEVRLKAEFLDAEGASALSLLHGVGLTTVKDCKVGHLYDVRGPVNQAQAQQAARDLLCDQVTQEFKLVQTAAPMVSNGSSAWRVEVWLKPTVTDAVGDSVKRALRELDLPEPESVRCGTVYRLSGRCHRSQLEKAVVRALANPVIHQVTISEEHA